MPNWCDNSAVITHKDKSKLEELREQAEQNTLFGFVLPEPDYDKVKVKSAHPEISGKEFANPKEAWWDWRVQNWGTKWEADFDTGFEFDEDLTLWFDTAWAP